jgi:hypothetical protein
MVDDVSILTAAITVTVVTMVIRGNTVTLTLMNVMRFLVIMMVSILKCSPSRSLAVIPKVRRIVADVR